MSRFWLSGPRLFGGLARPGISLALSKPRRRERREDLAGDRDPTNQPEIQALPTPAPLPFRIKVAVFLVWAFAIYGFLRAIISIAHAGDFRLAQGGLL